ncbi:MAG: glutamate 5-kinase [Gemmatimonadota bacterium]
MNAESTTAGATDRCQRMAAVRRLVVKVGTTTVAGAGTQLARPVIRRLVGDVVALRQRGLEVAIVTSGAVAAGMGRLGLEERPREVADLQAVAAVGQNLLMNTYEGLFRRHAVPVGQVLLTAEDMLEDRRRYLNLSNTFRQLFHFGAVPVINENDSVGVAELKRTIGENDMLAAYVANLIRAELLVIFSDVEGIYASVEQGPKGGIIREVRPGDGIESCIGAAGSRLGRGGMSTKVRAARLMTACGEMTVIAHGRRHRLLDVLAGLEVGTLFLPAGKRLRSRKRWIGFASPLRGSLEVDRGAEQAIVAQGRSLLPAGVVACTGDFAAGDVVRVESRDHVELARGVCRYAAAEVARIQGRSSEEVARILGRRAPEVIHRDDLVVL